MQATLLYELRIDPKLPIQKQLYQKISALIYKGDLPEGCQIPPTRTLAKELGISRNSITSVLDDLKAEGLLTSLRGSGFYVTDIKRQTKEYKAPKQWKQQYSNPSLSKFGAYLSQQPSLEHSVTLPFTPGVPDVSQFPMKIWNKLLRRHVDRHGLMGYEGNQGHAPLRRILADYLTSSRGVNCHPDQIVITHGAQQGISLCAQVLLDNNDRVYVENPGYIGAKKAFIGQGCVLSPVPLTDQGIDVDWLEKQVSPNDHIGLMYCSPTHQYPMGGILNVEARIKLLDWAAQNNTWIIEDDYDSEFHFYKKSIAAMQGMAKDTPVIYMGSFSKTLFPALRIGYLVLPESLVATFVKAKSYMTGETSQLFQAVIADFIEEGHFQRHLRKMRMLYKEKWQHFHALIEQELQGLATPVAKSAGMHLVLDIPNINDTRLSSQLKDIGYGSSPLSRYHITAKPTTGLVAGFANTTTEQRIGFIQALQERLR